MILSGCSKAFNTSKLSGRKLLVVSAFEKAMVRLNKTARRKLLRDSIPAILGLKARTPYVTARYIIQKALCTESISDDIRHDPKMDSKGRFSQDGVSKQVRSYRLIKPNYCPFERTYNQQLTTTQLRGIEGFRTSTRNHANVARNRSRKF